MPTLQKPPELEVGREEALRLVERIAESGPFLRSRRLQAFLRYVCTSALDQRLDVISEPVIGHVVFGREAGYNPNEDNIVRVEARELRKRLDLYFQGEGLAEAVIVEIPRGGYVPRFVKRPPPAPPEPRQRRSRLLIVTVILAAVCLILSVALVIGHLRTAGEVAASDPGTIALREFWAGMFQPEPATVFSVADSSFALLQDLSRTTVTFEDYVSGRYFSSLKARDGTELDRVMAGVATRHHTSLADAALVMRFLEHRPAGTKAAIRFARDIKVQDLKGRSIVMLGSERSNPWSGVFDAWRNFRIDYDTSLHRSLIRNKQPRPGEQAVYVGGPIGDKPYEAHGVLAYLPNLDQSGSVLLIAGTNMQGTEAAGEYLANSAKFAQLRQALGLTGEGPLPYFELVIKLVSVDASSISAEIVAKRKIDSRGLNAIRYTEH